MGHIGGFLGTPAPFMMDVVVVSLIAILPVLIYSISLAKAGRIELHKKIQWTLSVVLLLAVLLFEVEMRLAGGIANIMEPGRYTWPYRIYLWTHIAISILTIVIWIRTLMHASKNQLGLGASDEVKARHRRLGKLSAFTLLATSLTGLGVYAWSFL